MFRRSGVLLFALVGCHHAAPRSATPGAEGVSLLGTVLRAPAMPDAPARAADDALARSPVRRRR